MSNSRKKQKGLNLKKCAATTEKVLTLLEGEISVLSNKEEQAAYLKMVVNMTSTFLGM